MAQGRLVDGRAQRTEVVMVVHALELNLLAVQEESLAVAGLDAADAEAGGVGVLHLTVDAHLGLGCVEGRILRTPERGPVHHEVLCRSGARVNLVCVGVGSHFLALLIAEDGGECHFLALGHAFDVVFDAYGGVILAYVGSGEVCAPHGDMHFGGLYEMYVTVQACAGIPARAAWHVLEADFYFVVARHGHAVQVGGECIVAVWPVSHLTAVDLDLRMAHGAVKLQCQRFAGGVGDVYDGPVPAFAHVGETSGAACLPGLLGFAVLLHGHFLEVVFAVEGSVDGPVVRHGDVLPGRRVFGKFPVGDSDGIAERRIVDA